MKGNKMSKLMDLLGIELDQDEIEIGRSYPPELVGMLALNGVNTLIDWLKKNHAPRQVVDLADHVFLLSRAEVQLQNNNLPDFSANGLSEQIALTAQEIIALGGVFSGGGLQSIPHESLKWISPDELRRAFEGGPESEAGHDPDSTNGN
jgi:hypothetical protein